MKRSLLVVACWTQVVVATAYVVFSFYSQYTRPTLQLEFSRRTGMVRVVTPDGAAARADVRKGDVIRAINRQAPQEGSSPLFNIRAGEALPIDLVRGNEMRTVDIVPVTAEESRRSALRGGLESTLGAVVAYMSFPLHVWMLTIGIALISLRPWKSDARLAGLALCYWAGGSFLSDAAGMGVLLATLPVPMRLTIYLIDGAFVALFFAACLHLALVFPSDRTAKTRGITYVLPYLAALPIFLECAIAAARRAPSPPGPVSLVSSSMYLTLGPALLLASLIVFAIRFKRAEDVNTRRRLQLIFLALLPGAVAFTFSVLVSRLDSLIWGHIGRMANLAGTMASSAIFAYAVVRHRIFNIRFLLRRSLQYALARGTLLAIMSMPLIGLGLFLYAHRTESIAVLLTGTPAIYLLLIVPLLLVARYRRRLLDALDRRYFREQYDARRVLLGVVSMVRSGSDAHALTRVVLNEVERALHPRHMSLWHVTDDGREFQRGLYSGAGPSHPPALFADGTLPRLLTTDADPLDLSSRHTRSLVARLPVAERLWLGSTVAYLLVPLLIENRLVAIMVLGERLSEEPYSREDRALLRTLAAQLALTLDYSRLKESPALVWAPPSTLSTSFAAVKLCPSCGRCFDPGSSNCDVDDRPLVPEPGVPHVIDDKYVVTRILGRGGMGSVYMATQKRLNRPVAVKVLLTHLVGSSTMQSRFEREARIVARLHHPGIVTIHDFGVLATGHAYLIMEYLEGETLRKTILSGPQPASRVAEIIQPVGEAIDAAHRAGVVHRDLKPENIMLVRTAESASAAPRVLDFGLAKMSLPAGDDEATLVQSGHSAGIVGTLMYMAPEALSGRPVDARSDQYSLALITYELLAGMHPFGAATDLASVVKGHTDQPPPPLGDVVDVPDRVAAAVHRALSKNPADRFPSVGEFVRELG